MSLKGSAELLWFFTLLGPAFPAGMAGKAKLCQEERH